YFELNGQSREIIVTDHQVESKIETKPKVDATNEKQIGATMPGTVVKVLCENGDRVKKGDYLLITEAMKMERTVQAQVSGRIKQIHVSDGRSEENTSEIQSRFDLV